MNNRMHLQSRRSLDRSRPKLPTWLALALLTASLMLASMVTSSAAQAQAAGVSVGDFVWNDLNGDGMQDVGEPGVGGVVVSIVNPGGGAVLDSAGVALTAAQLSTTTSGTGAYSFSNLSPGAYRVTFTLPAGYVQTLSTQQNSPARDSNGLTSLSAVLTAGQSDTTIDLGLRVNAVSVGDFVMVCRMRPSPV
jgi:hypothetical protein